MSLGYRSIFTVPGRRADIVPIASAQVHAWLLHKRLDPERVVLGRRTVLGRGISVTVQELDGLDGSQSMRARLVERRSAGTWTSTLTVHVPGDPERDPWVWLDVESPSEGSWTARPKLAELLLTAVEGREGSAAFGSTPQVVTVDGVPALLDTIHDPDRRRLIFVAGSDAQMPIVRWVGLLEQLLRETVGLAGAYVLDANATDELRRALGTSHAVAPGTVRTYAPRVDPGSAVDAIRHRILSTERIISDETRAIARVLGKRSRETVTDQPLPRAMVRVDHALERQLDELLRAPSARAPLDDASDSTSSEPPVSHAQTVPVPAEAETASDEALGEDTTLRDLLVLAVREVLGVEEPPEAVLDLVDLARAGKVGEELADRLDDARTRLAASEDERDELRRQLEDEQVDHAETLQERAEAEALVAHLRKIAIATDPQADVWSPRDAAHAPSSLDELLDQIDTLPGLDCTRLDRELTRELDAYDQLGSWARKTWEALLALSDYARASADGTCTRDVDGYLRHTPDGCRSYSANRHARDESEDVRHTPAYYRPRVFPVPTAVDASGEVFMGAHFKIAQRGTISPRLHYYDATTIDGTVHVGYIGRHLPTQQTN